MRPRGKVERHGVEASARVGAHAGIAHGDALGGASRGAAALRKERDAPGPGDIALYRERWLPVVAPELLKGAQWHASLVVADAADVAERMLTAEARGSSAAKERPKRGSLCRHRVHLCQAGKPPPGQEAQGRGGVNHPGANRLR